MTKKECLDKYLGIPYTHLGRSLDGLDCYGFLILVYADLGWKLVDITNYEKNWSLKGEDLFVDNYQKQWERVFTPRLFDIVLIRNKKEIANHAGLYIDSTKFLHCIKAGVVIGKFAEDKWGKNIVGYYRFKRMFKDD